jgi:hypothetical protein
VWIQTYCAIYNSVSDRNLVTCEISYLRNVALVAKAAACNNRSMIRSMFSTKIEIDMMIRMTAAVTMSALAIARHTYANILYPIRLRIRVVQLQIHQRLQTSCFRIKCDGYERIVHTILVHHLVYIYIDQLMTCNNKNWVSIVVVHE